MTLESPQHRLRARAGAWNVTIERTLETESSVIGVGRRGVRGVVLKVVKTPGDEWHSGAVVRAFGGRGVVHVHEFEDGALLLERLSPGDSLADLASAGDDEAATAIVADVIHRMHAPSTPRGCPHVMDWCAGFDGYLRSGDQRIPTSLVDDARARFASLASSQRRPRLLHGDLQHYNILFDTNRGWLAIDPKGVVGEVEYEVGALLRNPAESPDLFASAATVARRVSQLSGLLGIDPGRTLEWGYVQAVLSAIWCLEDGHEVTADSAVLRLANVIRSMISGADPHDE